MSASFIGSFLIGQKINEIEAALNDTIGIDTGSRLSELESWVSDRVRYVYPNGGSEGDEKTLSLSTVYHEISPFPQDVNFTAVTEFYSESLSEWIDYNCFYYAGAGVGCHAYSRPVTGTCVVVVGDAGFGGNAHHGGAWNSEVPTSLKWRVRCVKEG